MQTIDRGTYAYPPIRIKVWNPALTARRGLGQDEDKKRSLGGFGILLGVVGGIVGILYLATVDFDISGEARDD